jgi:hypothetical protein
VLGRSDLREVLRFGGIRFMTANAQHGGIKFGGLHRTGIIGMFRQGPVARFAVDVHMLAAVLFAQHVCVAVLAGLVAGKVHRASGDLAHGVSTIVSVLPETPGHKKCTHSHKHQAANDENRSQTKQVPSIFENIHKMFLLDTVVRHHLAVRQVTRTLCFRSQL